MWYVKTVLTSQYLEKKNTIFLFGKNSQQKSFLARLHTYPFHAQYFFSLARTGVSKICQRARPLIQEQTVRFYLPPLAYASRHMFHPTFFPQYFSTECLIHLLLLFRPSSHHYIHYANLLSNELFKRTCFSLSHCLDAYTHASLFDCDVLRVSVRRTAMSSWRDCNFRIYYYAWRISIEIFPFYNFFVGFFIL